MAGKGVSRLCRREGTEEKMLLTCGASAGLSAAFNAPLAGVLFSLEELHKDFSTDVLLSTMSASITADFVSRTLCGPDPEFDFPGLGVLPLSQYWMVLVLSLIHISGQSGRPAPHTPPGGTRGGSSPPRQTP